jgi:hypothetical protein
MKQVSNFTMVDVSGLQANSNSFIIDVAGNCMNSDKSGHRIFLWTSPDNR